jgi:hypothetical protein
MANDEFDALDALEKEAKEYDKVCSMSGPFIFAVIANQGTGR